MAQQQHRTCAAPRIPQAKFDAAAAFATEKLLSLTNDEKLELYGLFKQAKEGDVSIGGRHGAAGVG